MAEDNKPLLIKRYASRRLYNTETSDYVTLEDIAGFIREGREVQIVDLKSGDDLTRQYLLQITTNRRHPFCQDVRIFEIAFIRPVAHSCYTLAKIALHH